jgi:raffinose/stachyose/melibiose transport system substrate-binding protein
MMNRQLTWSLTGYLLLIILALALPVWLLRNDRLSDGDNRSAEPSAAPVTVTLWAQKSNDGRQTGLVRSVEEFNHSQTGIRIVPYFYREDLYKSKLRVALASGKMPDLFYVWFGRSFEHNMVESGRVADLTDWIDGHPDFRDRFEPGALERGMYDGRIYGVPHSVYHMIIWYNKKMFLEHGLAPPVTWEDLIEAVRTLKANGVVPIAVAGKERWPLINWFAYLSNRIGGSEPFERVVRGEGDFTDPSFVEAALKMRELVEHDAFIPGFTGMTWMNVEDAFLDGAAAMYLQGDWSAEKYLSHEDIGFFRFPDLGGEGELTHYYGGYGAGWAIARNGNVDAALQVLDFLLSPTEWARFVAANTAPSPAVNRLVLLSDTPGPVLEYLRYVQTDATGYFGYYDQELDPRRAQLLMDAILKLVHEPEMTREDIVELLGSIR